MYTTMFDDCIKDGLVTIIGMQELVALDSTQDGEKINEIRQSLLVWAREAQLKMAVIIKQVSLGEMIYDVILNRCTRTRTTSSHRLKQR